MISAILNICQNKGIHYWISTVCWSISKLTMYKLLLSAQDNLGNSYLKFKSNDFDESV